MTTVAQTVEVLEQFAPPALAESWDNVGLLVGDRGRPVQRLMTCLTMTPATVQEAVGERADLVVVHHPLPFRPVQRITTDTTAGKLLLELIESRVAVYSPHTAFDSARRGINQRLAEGLELHNIRPALPSDAAGDPTVGGGRIGETGDPLALVDLAKRLKQFLGIERVRAVGDHDKPIRRVAIGCGSGGTFLEAAIEHNVDSLVTGETSFHTCLEAEARGVGLLLVGHFASERFALDLLAEFLAEQLPDVQVWAARSEQDPLYIL